MTFAVGKVNRFFIYLKIKCKSQMKNLKNTPRNNFRKPETEKLENYMQNVLDQEQHEFLTNFKKLSRKLQFYIVNLVNQAQTHKKNGNEELYTEYTYILDNLYMCKVFEYSHFKIIKYIKSIYL